MTVLATFDRSSLDRACATLDDAAFWREQRVVQFDLVDPAMRARVSAYIRQTFAIRDARRQVAVLDPHVGDPVCAFLVSRYGAPGGGAPCAS